MSIRLLIVVEQSKKWPTAVATMVLLFLVLSNLITVLVPSHHRYLASSWAGCWLPPCPTRRRGSTKTSLKASRANSSARAANLSSRGRPQSGRTSRRVEVHTGAHPAPGPQATGPTRPGSIEDPSPCPAVASWQKALPSPPPPSWPSRRNIRGPR